MLLLAWWTHDLDTVFAAELIRSSLLMLFLELSGYCVNAMQRNVYAADVVVRGGVDRDDYR